MSHHALRGFAAALLALGLVAGCNLIVGIHERQQWQGADDAADDSTDDADAGDSTVDAPPPPADGGPLPRVRLANLSPDLYPAVDYCVASGGGVFDGPILRKKGWAGLSYPQVGVHVAAGPLPLAVRVVDSTSVDCSVRLDDVSSDATIVADDSGAGGAGEWTVALMGSAVGPPWVEPYVFPDDELAKGDGAPFDTYQTRIVHAAPHAGALDIVAGGGAFVQPEQSGLVFGHASSAGTQSPGGLGVNPDGYLQLVDPELLTVRRSTTDLVAAPITWAAGSSVFVVGLETSMAPLGVVICEEGYPVVGGLSECTFSAAPPQFYPLRLANMAPFPAGLDLCVGLKLNYPGLQGPLLAAAGVDGGVGFLRMTDAIAMLPLGSSLDIAAVAAGTDCTQQNRVINGTWSWVPLAEFDLVTLQTFQASPTHEATTADIVPQNPNLASLDLVNMVAEMNAESVDVYASPMGGAESQLGMTVNPNVSGQVLTLAPGTYSVRVVDHGGGGQLYARSGIVLGAGDRFGVWWIHDSLGHGTLALCNLAPPGSGKLTACTD